ncbi:hypothetical protein CPB97_010492 [Podila verticillata]|nr:hypothetical protein CPB97_010492 [Podila verticillata]
MNEDATCPVDQPMRGDDDLDDMDPVDLPLADMDPDDFPLDEYFTGMTLADPSSLDYEVEQMDSIEETPSNDFLFGGQCGEPQDLDLPSSDIDITENDAQNLTDSAVGFGAGDGQPLPSTSNTFTILVLGETQSGKSMLIESFKHYANPDYVINTGRIGDGAFSHTTEVKIERLFTNLPKSFISRASDDSRKRVDHEEFINEDQEDYEDELNDRKTYQVGREQSDQPIVYFNLIDTPGLNNTGSNETGYLENVFRRLGNISDINMVIITVSNNPFTQDLKDALKSYFELLKEFKGILVFVHTKIDYAKLHQDDEQFAQLLAEKNNLLHELLGQDAPHIMIDNDLGSKKAVRNCMTQNILRELLEKAKTNEPVAVPAQYRPRPPLPPVYRQSFESSWDPYNSRHAPMGIFFNNRGAIDEVS